MSETRREVTEADLLAYVDGQLPPAEREAVERYLAANPARAAEVAHWQRQNEALHALFDPAGNEPVPTALRPASLARGRAANANFRWTQVAAAVALVVLGGAIGWAGRDVVTHTEAASDVLIDSAVTAHSLYVKENRHAVEVAADDREHLVSWLSNRVTQPINPPDLGAEGFAFIGGRLLPPAEYGETGPAAQLMYENAASERVTVYITSALPDGATVSEFTNRGPHEAFYWANDKITCTVVGELPDAQMQTVAKKVYQQLTRRPDGSAAPMQYNRGS
jgi:anti-sigma factor RsiW